jgi:AAA family ATP:ADP antiporter
VSPKDHRPETGAFRAAPDGLAGSLEVSGPQPGPQRLSSAALGIRPGEGWLAWLFFLYFLLLATCHYIGKSVRSSTYVDILGATNLPYAYLLVALVSFPVLVMYSRLATRISQKLLISLFCLLQATGLIVFFWLFSLEQKWVPIAFYVWTTVAFSVGLSQFWSYANHVFDARQAKKRAIPFVAPCNMLKQVSKIR